jgi:hypothetical protein
MKNDFINSNIPWAVPIIDGLQYVPYVGESIKTINDIEKVLKLINSGKYKEAQNMAIKKGVLMYIQSQLPVPISEKMMDTALDTIEFS